MKRLVMTLAALALVVAACADDVATTTSSSLAPEAPPETTNAPGSTASTPTPTTGAPTTSSTPPTFDGMTLESDDGGLLVQIPSDAYDEDPGFSIRTLEPSEYPEVLQGASASSGASIYAIEPLGFEFLVPVGVTRYLSRDSFADLAFNQVPLASLNYTIDGDEFHQVSGPVIFANEDRFGTFGTIGTAGTIITLREGGNFEVDTDGVAHEEEEFSVGLGFRDLNGNLLDLDWIAGDGIADPGAEVHLDGSRTWVRCLTGDSLILSHHLYNGRVPVDAGGTSLLTSTAALTGGNFSDEYAFALSFAARCLPRNSFNGLSTSYQFVVEHFSSQSELRGTGMFLSGGPRAMYMGLIEDTNSNGWVDADDSVFEPQHVDIAGDGSWEYTDALFNFGNKFVYATDLNIWEDLELTSRSVRWSEIVTAVGMKPGFSTGAGVLTMAGDTDWMLTLPVGPSEGVIADSLGEQAEFQTDPTHILLRLQVQF